MILNMSYGASKAQIVDFTLSQDTDIHDDWFTVNNVRLSSGTFSRFVIMPISQVTLDNLAIVHIFSPESISNVTQSKEDYVRYSVSPQTGNSYILERDNNDNDFQYDATTQTAKFRIALSGAHLVAGTYRLVIW